MQEILSVAYGFILLASAVCFFVVTTQKASRQQQIMQLVVTFVVVLMLGYWIRAGADTLEELVISQKLIYLSGCFLYYYIFMFCLKYCFLELPKVLREFLPCLSVVTALVTFTFDRHTLLYHMYWMEEQNGIFVLEKEYGVFHTIYIALTMLYCVALLGVAIWYGIHNMKRRRRQSILLITVPFCPTIPYLVEKLADLPYDIVPFGIILGLLLMMYLMYVEKIYDLNDTAREFVFSSVDAALVVLDSDRSYKGANQFAIELFPELKQAVLNDSIENISGTLCEIIDGKQKDIYYQDKIYEADVKKLTGDGKIFGVVLWLSNVTSQREHLKFLEEYQTRLQHEVLVKTEHIQSIQEKILVGMANMVENRDPSTGGHIKRTSEIVRIMVTELAKSNEFELSEEFCRDVISAAPMHDLGKIAVEDVILCKPGRFTDEEYEIMKNHSVKGAEIVQSVLAGIEDESFVTIAENIAHYHHEKWDGTGYPECLAGEDIPLEARIMAIADVYDALVSKRCYKNAMSFEQAYRIVEESMGQHFDPRMGDCFARCRSRLEDYYKEQLG